MKKTVAAFLIIGIMIVSLSGCAADSSLMTEKIFRFAVSTKPETFDPTMCNSITDNEIQHAITEGLTRTTGGTISPGIAESWDVSEDGRIYTFHLRDAKWSDGKPITAHDFVYSWRRLADPATGSEYGFAIWMVEGGKEINLKGADPETLGIKAIDDKTLEVRLVDPTAYFLGYIGSQSCFAPIRQDIVSSEGDNFARTPDNNVYSGPFLLKSHEDNVCTFKKNPDFWDSKSISLNGAELYYIEDADEQLQMFNSKKIDFTTIPNEKLLEYRKSEYVNHYLNGTVYFCYINTTSKNKILGDRDFRNALNYSIDRNTFNHKVNNNMNKPYGALVFPGLIGKDGVTYGEAYDIRSYAFPLDGDIDLARRYLKTAMEKHDIRHPELITLELLIPETENDKKTAKELQEQWTHDLNIIVNIKSLPRSEFYGKALPAGDYDIALSGWGPDYNDPSTYLNLFRSDNTSYTPYSNPDLDALLDKADACMNQKTRMDVLNAAEQMVLKDSAIIPLQARDIYYMLNPAISNLTLSFCNITLDWAYAGKAEEGLLE